MKLIKLIVFVYLFSFSGINAQTRIYNFTAISLKDSVRLSFTVSQGSTCAGWQVLKSSDSLTFNTIYSYPGLCGNSTFSQTYTYSDISPNKLTPNFYQIQIPPNDYSPVRRVDLATNFSNLLIFPQPVEDILNIAINGQKNYYYEIHIYDRFGRKKFFGNGNATDKITLDVSSFSEGVYVFYIAQSNGTTYRGKFLKKPKAY